MTLSVCPSREELELFAEGELGTEVACGISNHVATCQACHVQLLELERAAHGTVRDWLTSNRKPADLSSRQGGFFEWLARRSPSLNSRSRLPQFIAGYRLNSCLGIGGTGVVFQAWDLQHKRLVAIKVMRTGLGERSVKRFNREVKIAASVDHPNIVKLFSTTLTRFNKPAIVMEYFPSVDLKAAIDQQGPLSIAQTSTIGSAIIQAVKHLHSMQVLHRDVKPRNTLLTRCGQIKLVDFGIAVAESDDTHVRHESSITRTGQLMGSIGFTSPQVLQTGHNIQTDIFSVCATMYYLLTGHQPYSHYQRLEDYLTLASTEKVQPIAELRNEPSHPLFELIESIINCRASDHSTEVIAHFLERHKQVDCLNTLLEKLDFAPPANLQIDEAVKFLSDHEDWARTRNRSMTVTRMKWMIAGVIVSLLVGTLSFRAFQQDQVISDSSLPQATLDEIVAITRQTPSTDESLVSTQLTLYNVSIRLLEAELQKSNSKKVKEVLLDVYHNRGILEAGVGTQSQAIEFFRQELELANSLFARYPDHLNYAAKQTTALGALAVMQLNLQNLPIAEQELQKCLELEKRVLAVDRRLEPVAKNHCSTFLNLSHLYLETKRPELARKVLRDAWIYLEENWESGDPAVAQERNLLRLNSHLAHAQLGNFVQALTDLEACIQGWDSMLNTAPDPNGVRMRLVEALREGADTYLAAGDAEASSRALRRANSIAAQVTLETPHNKFHRAVAGESSLNLAMLATQYPSRMSDVNVLGLVAESQKVFGDLYQVEPIESWINQLKRTYVCEAAALRGANLEQAIEKLESLKRLPDAKFSIQLWRDFTRVHSLCRKASRELSRKELEQRLDTVWQQNWNLFEQFQNTSGTKASGQ